LLKQEAVTGNLITASMLMTKIYISQKNSIEAKSYLDIVAKLKQKINSHNFSYDINKLLSDYYQLEGNDKLSLYHLQLAIIYKDSLNVATNLNKEHKAETIFEKEKSKLVLNQIENKMLNERAIGFILFLLLISLVVSVSIYFDRSKLKFKLEQKELLDKNEKIASELDQANVRLEQFLQSRLQKDREKRNTDQQENIVSKLTNESMLHTEADWTEFRTFFEQAHPRYLQRVKEKLPKISPAELRLLAIHKLNLNTNEMALILNISPDAVRKLKKRFALKTAENLHQTFDEFINSIQ
jgi:DNA-binding CsgD family transcriptional regulator